MKAKTSFQVLTILALLAFGPTDAREIWFRSSPDLLYGERLLYSDAQGAVYLGRNSSSVAIGFNQPVDTLLSDLHATRFQHKQKTTVFEKLAQGIVIQRSEETVPRECIIDGHLPYRAGSLYIETESERSSNLAIAGIIFFLAGYLIYLASDYQWRFSPQFEAEKQHGSPSLQ